MLLDLTTHDQKTVVTLLKAFLPDTTIWAFGSRMKFTSKPESDLDLVAFIGPEQQSQLAELKDAFAESDLPFKVDILDWNIIPDSFKENIEKDYVKLIDATNKRRTVIGWQWYKLGDLIEKITKGTTPSTMGERFFETGINFIKSEAVGYDGRIDKSTFVFIDSNTHEKLKRSQLQVDDILFSMAGIFLGKNAVVTEDILPANTNQALAIIRVNQKKALAKFIHFYLRQPNVVKQINSMSGQSAQPNINFEEIKSIPIYLPNLNTQTKIVFLLSSIEEKIHLNQQMNKTLETIAQAIFKEWFVNFNFPGFDGELVNGLPKGWRKGKLQELAKVEIGRTPPRGESHWFSKDSNDINWISIRDLGQNGIYIFNTSEYLTEEAKDKFRIPEIRENTIVLSFKLTIGRVAITTKRMLSNEAIAQINSTDFAPEYLFCYLNTYPWDSLGSTSSIASAINSKIIKDMPVLIPELELSKLFSNAVRPIFEKLKINSKQITTLVELRDSLLPKLMTGQIKLN